MTDTATNTQLGYALASFAEPFPYWKRQPPASGSSSAFPFFFGSAGLGSLFADRYGARAGLHRSGALDLDGRLRDAYLFASATFDGLDRQRLARAYGEAMQIAACAIFQETLFPEVSIDPNGEITLSCKTGGGYVDIGVSGDQALSYHVRNDVDPSLSAYADMEWKDYKVPAELLDALEALQA